MYIQQNFRFLVKRLSIFLYIYFYLIEQLFFILFLKIIKTIKKYKFK